MFSGLRWEIDFYNTIFFAVFYLRYFFDGTPFMLPVYLIGTIAAVWFLVKRHKKYKASGEYYINNSNLLEHIMDTLQVILFIQFFSSSSGVK